MATSDLSATGTTGAGAGDGSGISIPSGTPDPSVGGSADVAALQARLDELSAENERTRNQFQQLLSEKTNTELMRREAERIIGDRDEESRRQLELQQLAAGLQSSDMDEFRAATQRVIGMLGSELVQLRQQNTQEIRKTRELIATPIPDVIPAEIRQAAIDAFDAGSYSTLKDAIAAKVGEAVLAGKALPALQPAPAPAPTPAPAVPAGVRPAASPVSTVTRSVVEAPAGLPDRMSSKEYLALPPDRFREAYRRRMAGTLQLTE